MANKECVLEASVTERESPDLNVPKCWENVEKFERDDSRHEGKKQNDFDKTFTQEPCKEFLERKSDDLFANVPELKANFVIENKIGEGTFSDVYLASLVKYPDEKFALKHIIPTSSPDRVEREIRCLQEMGGKNNVIGYKGTIRHCDHNVIILPYFPHDRFQDYLHSMTVSSIQDYIKNLLLALKHIHSFSIIHRDIKPGNFLHCRKSGRYNLVDFGLAMHEPGSRNAWDIEKKNGKYSKSSNVKNARQLSPESISKNSQVPKKPRTSPRVAVTSHKLARQANGVVKSTVKETAKPSVENSGSKDVETSAKQKNRAVRFVSPSEQEKKLDGKSLPLSSKMATGLCQTKHKTYEICTLCIKRVAQSAPRAGTSGFRAPEVLLKHPEQTTAVDVWSAGIIFLCLLSGKYPFFRCADDMTALAQIITVFGKQRVMESTKHLGKYMVCNSISPGYELKKLCQKLRSAKQQKENEEISTKCCNSCSKLLPKNEPSSPASNLRRTSLHASPKTTGVESNTKDTLSTKNSKIGESDKSHSRTVDRDKKVLQVSPLQQNPTNGLLSSSQTDSLKSSKTKPSENLRNGHVGNDDKVPNTAVRTHASKGESKVRLMSEGSRDQTGEPIREHLDGSRCTCDCGSCSRYVPASAYDLLERCLDLNPATRITANEALNHTFLQDRKSLGMSPQPES
ncbi:cell division cycle 7-related protein kinase-like [Dendronephthya gigantea]|uniref:cell division cycle 7-related protein kinase-like n=1 Tax=Dendronephthya gigantea TaxID=151771 RepID=UPI00106ADBDF|nr:cell division cycle 7-related protein kinase-like [Dendronephthya gigantea]